MRILAARTHYLDNETKKERLSAVDWWRIENPLREIVKHRPDIQVDFVNKIVKDGQTEVYAWDSIGQQYDIVYASYFDTPKAYSYLKAIKERYGIQIIMDLDDDIFDVDPLSPSRIRYYPGSEHLKNAAIIMGDVDYMICSTPYLADVITRYRNKPIFVMENYINPDMFKFSGRTTNNGDRIVIGYQGSATHLSDLLKTGVLWAIRRLLYEFDNVDFMLVGSIYDDVRKYIPTERLLQQGGYRHFPDYVNKVWKTMPFDIGIAPLQGTSFNKSKSAIKYYEYSLRYIPAVLSWEKEYMEIVWHGRTAFLAQTEDEWYHYLRRLVVSAQLRRKMAESAHDDVMSRYTIQDNWPKLAAILDHVYESR